MATLHTPPPHFGGIQHNTPPSLKPKPSLPTPSGKPTGKPRTSTPILLLSSAVAGSVEALATYPFEYAKTLVQLQPRTPQHLHQHHNPFSVLLHVARREGLSAIYTGCSPLVLGSAFKVSVRFASYSYFRAHLVDSRGVLTPGRGVLAGALAGLVESVVAVTPTERVKTLLIERGRGGGVETGMRSLYRGLLPTLLKQSATQGVKMGSYNLLRELSRRWDVPHSPAATFLTGALAGAVTVYVTQPLDAVKTQAQRGRGAGTGAAFRAVIAQSGVRGLWAGSTARVGRVACSSSILYTVYERVVSAVDGGLEGEVFVFTPIARERW